MSSVAAGAAVSPPQSRVGDAADVRWLAGYRGARGARQLVALSRGDGCTLLLDCAAGAGGDTRVLAVLGADEPVGNVRLLCRLYLSDPTRGRCRRMAREDLLPPAPSDAPEDTQPDLPLVDPRGWVYRIAPLRGPTGLCELRWRRSVGSDSDFEPLSLRDVVGALESYEPARSLTVRALVAASKQPFALVARLRAELQRLDGSPIVLNRGLREAVAREVAAGSSLSTIAMRCGRRKHDCRGHPSGETSWLARRVGMLPEGGGSEPTPWVHSDTLALIAREGLGLAPVEVEL
jgi:hypothetical protein